MDAAAFLSKHGKDFSTQVAQKAGTNWAYFSQIAHGHRRPSVDLAHKLASASAELIPAETERLDVLSLLQPKEAAA